MPYLAHVLGTRWSIPNALGDGNLLLVSDIVKLYVEHDTHLRAGTVSSLCTPIGYDEFVLAFNNQQLNNTLPERLTLAGPNGPQISGPAPTIHDLVGPLPSIPQPTNPTAHARIPEGGRYLTPQRAELMEEALWMSLESTKRKREWRDRAIADRKSKRAKGWVSGHHDRREGAHQDLALEAPNDNSLAQASGSTASTSSTGQGLGMDIDGGNGTSARAIEKKKKVA
ncbi:hypothetical protein DEU56DRAFT_802102 [Suillus clintonianus]|uniref:uncharacterized protein n=1 Tax=Suillus clintonianus TaxID=1904413 RepID=UPI001B875473|nr:uncharacterized protein DEU56DRAFT_802102 [Suillus clintonianus]KAG2138512.1 hypothetical protein DEU56DRAFT_802102 [Suillus clintonianus]